MRGSLALGSRPGLAGDALGLLRAAGRNGGERRVVVISLLCYVLCVYGLSVDGASGQAGRSGGTDQSTHGQLS